MTEPLQGNEQPVVDFEALKARCLGNLDLVERVLSKFTSQLDGDLKELERALSLGDTSRFAQVAHRIKGSSANIEAHYLFADAAAAEQLARQNCVTELPDRLQRLQQDHKQFCETLAGASR